MILPIFKLLSWIVFPFFAYFVLKRLSEIRDILIKMYEKNEGNENHL
ncbi:hypothetical protein [Desemzia sp. FAM 23991]